MLVRYLADVRKLFVTFMWEKGPRIAKTILKNKVEELYFLILRVSKRLPHDNVVEVDE